MSKTNWVVCLMKFQGDLLYATESHRYLNPILINQLFPVGLKRVFSKMFVLVVFLVPPKWPQQRSRFQDAFMVRTK